MSMELRFTVPGPPQPKGRPRLGRGGRVYTPDPTRSYEIAVRTYAMAAIGHARGWSPLPQMRVRLAFFQVDRRRQDLDNLAKAVLDAMNHVAFADDSQIAELHCYRSVDAANPRVEVTVTPMEET